MPCCSKAKYLALIIPMAAAVTFMAQSPALYLGSPRCSTPDTAACIEVPKRKGACRYSVSLRRGAVCRGIGRFRDNLSSRGNNPGTLLTHETIPFCRNASATAPPCRTSAEVAMTTARLFAVRSRVAPISPQTGHRPQNFTRLPSWLAGASPFGVPSPDPSPIAVRSTAKRSTLRSTTAALCAV